MTGIDWESLGTEDEAAEVALQALQAMGLSGGVFSFTPIGRLPSGIPGLLKRAIPLNLEQRVIEDWFQYQNELEGRAQRTLSQS